jgi:hypothetical protein
MERCIVLTRNGCGDVWVFSNIKTARLHPIPQIDDVYATSAGNLVEQYGRGLINDLLRFAEGRDRARLIDAFETWRNGASLSPEVKELLWSKVYQAGATPPDDPAEIVRIIKEDRLFREGRVLRSINTGERSSANPATTRKEMEMSEAARRRTDENATITVLGKDGNGENPKRAGSKAFDRFALYENGMTVREAKAAGVQATDIAYDFDHKFIELTPGEATEEASDEGEEVAPKKKSKKAA